MEFSLRTGSTTWGVQMNSNCKTCSFWKTDVCADPEIYLHRDNLNPCCRYHDKAVHISEVTFKCPCCCADVTGDDYEMTCPDCGAMFDAVTDNYDAVDLD